jgi:hypothetical protein
VGFPSSDLPNTSHEIVCYAWSQKKKKCIILYRENLLVLAKVIQVSDVFHGSLVLCIPTPYHPKNKVYEKQVLGGKYVIKAISHVS